MSPNVSTLVERAQQADIPIMSRPPMPAVHRLRPHTKSSTLTRHLLQHGIAAMSVQCKSLQRWQDKRLAFDRIVREDWRLLETDDTLLQEMIYNG